VATHNNRNTAKIPLGTTAREAVNNPLKLEGRNPVYIQQTLFNFWIKLYNHEN
jgi:hypothetical protein